MMSRSRSQGTEVTIVTGDVFYAQYDLMKVTRPLTLFLSIQSH